MESISACVADNSNVDFIHALMAARLEHFRTTRSDGNEFGSKVRKKC
jgi:hypothetical protein